MCCRNFAATNPAASRNSPVLALWCPVRTIAPRRSTCAIIASAPAITAASIARALRFEPLRVLLAALLPRLPRGRAQPGIRQADDFSALNVMS